MPQFGNSGDKIWQTVAVARHIFGESFSVIADRPSQSTNRRLMSSPERFQNIVLAVERPAMPMKNLSTTTRRRPGDFPITERNRG